MSQSEPTRLRQGSRIAHYRLDAPLGAGGMGQVFRARDLALGREAAVKVIRADVDPALTERLLREVEASRRLQHPAIATFFEGGEEAGHAYFAMELIEGVTLRRRLEDGPLPPTETLGLAAGLLEALAHAHAAGVLHRDIKPENIMIAASGAPKLLDFGLARRLFEADVDEGPGIDVTTMAQLTAHGAIPGTPGYMSPEQLRGQPLGPASDVFQMGALLFEMLTGRRVFGTGSIVARIGATFAGVPDLSALTRLRPAGLDTIVRTALAALPVDRFHSAGAFLMALDASVEGRLRTALPESVVVVDFENRSGDPSDDWIGTAVAETVTNELARLDGLKVGPRAPASRAADAASAALALGVRWALAGSFQRAGDRLRLLPRLIDASTGREITIPHIDGRIDDLFDLQDALVTAVAAALNVERRTAPRSAAPDVRALELHAKARELWRQGIRDPRIVAMLEEAVAISPEYAPALAGSVAALSTRFIVSGDAADLERAIALSDRAIAVDDSNCEAWTWRGYALSRLQRKAEALAALRRAVEIAGDDPFPPYMYGAVSQSDGLYDEALPYLQRAVTLEPRFGMAWLALGSTLQLLARYEAARYALEHAKALEGQPGLWAVAGVGGYIAECLRCEGQLARARLEALAGLESIERSDFSYRDTVRALCLGALGRVTLLQEDRVAAQAAFSQAIAQLKGRSRALGGGHALVQSLAGLARTTGEASSFEEALRLFEIRNDYSFKDFFGCVDAITLLELARTAHVLNRLDHSRMLLDRARAAGSREAFGYPE